jgi:hypothetical protein
MSISLDEFRRDVNSRRLESLRRIEQVPIAVLVWGPSPESDDPVALTRRLLREKLIESGHLAEFSEDLCDRHSHYSIIAQQVSQARVFDIIFSIPGSYGSIAEIHDFVRMSDLSSKLIIFIDIRERDGYSAQSLIAADTSGTCKVEMYNASELPECVLQLALDKIRRLQELFYISGRR